MESSAGQGRAGRLLRYAGLLCSVGIAAALLWYAARGVSGGNLLHAIRNVHLPWLTAYCISIIAIHLLRAWRWQLLLGRGSASFGSVLASLLLCYGANDIIPRSGELLRAMALGRASGLSTTGVMGTIVVERVYDLLSFGLCVLASGFLFRGVLYGAFPWILPLLWAGSALLAAAVAVMWLAARNRVWVAAAARKLASPAGHKAAAFLARHTVSFISGFSRLPSARAHAAVFSLSLVLMAVYTLSTHSVFYAMRMEQQNVVSLQLSLLLMCMSAVGVMIPAPGGIGSVHAITVTLLAGGFAYSRDSAMALAVMSHGVSYLFHLSSGSLAAIWLYKKRGLFPLGALRLFSAKTPQ